MSVDAARRPNLWREIPMLMGSCAESALLAASAEVEIECLRRAMATGDLPKEFGLAQRFFAEAQANQILGVGHKMANIAVRTLMLAPDYPWDGAGRASLPAFSNHPGDWVSMSQMKDYRKAAAKSPYGSLVGLTTIVVNILGTGQWKDLEERRGSDFHRSREESPFVTGASRTSPWRSLDGTTVILEPRLDMPTCEEVDRWLADLGKESHAALLKLAVWLRSFREALYASVPEITDGKFRIE
jgi:hypothetical protein